MSMIQTESNSVNKNWKFYEPEGQMERCTEYVFIVIDQAPVLDDMQSRMKRKRKHRKSKKEILKKRNGKSEWKTN